MKLISKAKNVVVFIMLFGCFLGANFLEAQTPSSDWMLKTHATNISNQSGGEALAIEQSTGDIIVKSLRDPQGYYVQLTRISSTGNVNILAPFPVLKNSNGSGIMIDPTTGGLIVADEAGNLRGRIVLIDLSTRSINTLYDIPWIMNPFGNGTGQQQYAIDSVNPTDIFFWDSTVSKLFKLNRMNNELSEILALDQATPSGQHLATYATDIVFDPIARKILMADGGNYRILEIDPNTVPVTVIPLVTNLAITPRSIAFNHISGELFLIAGDSIYSLPRSGGETALVASGFINPTDIAVGSSTLGNGLSLFVVDKNKNALYEITRKVQITANAGLNQTIEQTSTQGENVTLDASASKIEGCSDAVAYEWTWNGGSAEGVKPTILLPAGTSTVTLKVTACGVTSEPDTVDITVRDTIAPGTDAKVTGTLGSNGWYTSNVDIALTAIDSGSGVKEIRYSINNGAETVVSGSIANISLTADGVYAIQYYAVDNADNKETAHPLTIKIDRAVPVVQITPSNTILWPPNHKLVPITINGSAVDNESGIASVVITVADEYGAYNQTITSGFGTTINLEAWREGTDKDGRVYTITATATDKAGNVSTAVTTVTVPHDMGK